MRTIFCSIRLFFLKDPALLDLEFIFLALGATNLSAPGQEETVNVPYSDQIKRFH